MPTKTKRRSIVTKSCGSNQKRSFNRDPPDRAFRPTIQISSECIVASSKSPVSDDSDDGGGESRERNGDEIRDLANQSSHSAKARSNTSDIPDEVDSEDEIGAWVYQRSRAANARADESLSAAVETKSAITGAAKLQKAKEKNQNQTPLLVPKRTIPAEADNCATPPKRLRKTCSHEGCTTPAQSGGVCIRHGAKQKHKECTHEGCTNQVKIGGVCYRHGVKRKEWTHKGCTTPARSGGLCQLHRAYRKKCSHK